MRSNDPRTWTDAEIRAEIERLYKQGATKHHPDKGLTSKTPEQLEAANKAMQLLNRVHDHTSKIK